ncbi:MAG TPA: hypothetical protein VKB88_46715 [Bryobacteraceae bacterium]|nr:hypothetical protein [Bryobacteraceae bacterium]
MTPELAARLAAYRIELVTEAKEYTLVARENCFAMLHLGERSVPGIGSAGMITDHGLTYLVWREGEPRLVGKRSNVAAGPQAVEAIRRFAEDLKEAVAGS